MFLPFKNRFSLQFGRRRVAFLICFIMSFDSAIFPAPFWAMSPEKCDGVYIRTSVAKFIIFFRCRQIRRSKVYYQQNRNLQSNR